MLNSQIKVLEERLKTSSLSLGEVFNLAHLFFRAGRIFSALQILQKLIQVEPKHIRAKILLAKIFFYQKMYEEALKELVEVSVLEPTHIKGYLLYRKISRELRDPSFLKEWKNFKFQEDAINKFKEEILKEQEIIEQDLQICKQNTQEPIFEFYYQKLQDRKKLFVDEFLADFEELSKILSIQKEEKLKEVEKEEKVLSFIQAADYQVIQADLLNILNEFLKIKNIDSIAVFDLEGRKVSSIFKENILEEELYLKLSNFLKLINELSMGSQKQEFNLWICEFKEGLSLIQRLTNYCWILILGEEQTNLGALKYILEKNKNILVEILNRLKI